MVLLKRRRLRRRSEKMDFYGALYRATWKKDFFLLFLKTFLYFFYFFCTFLYFLCTFLVLQKNFFNGLGFKPKSKIKFSQKRLDEYRSYFQYYRRILSSTIFQIFGKIYCTDIEKMGNSSKNHRPYAISRKRLEIRRWNLVDWSTPLIHIPSNFFEFGEQRVRERS